MKIVFTGPALVDLDEILTYTGENYPHLVDSIEDRIHEVIAHIRRWPRNARMIDDRHTSRQLWTENGAT